MEIYVILQLELRLQPTIVERRFCELVAGGDQSSGPLQPVPG